MKLENRAVAERTAFGGFAVKIALRIPQQAIDWIEAIGAEVVRAKGMQRVQRRRRRSVWRKRKHGQPARGAKISGSPVGLVSTIASHGLPPQLRAGAPHIQSDGWRVNKFQAPPLPP
jgi:hypothetical protein